LAAIDLLASRAGASAVSAWDGSREPSLRAIRRGLERRGVRCALGGDGSSLLDGVACLVKSPGIAPDHELLVAARERGIATIDELELGWRATRVPMLAVTGTKGKSTVTTLLSGLGAAAAGAAPMAGNTDFAPALSSVRGGGVIACEVSSQQLEGCTDLLPEIGILTNVHYESNRHGGLEATAAIKRTLFVRGDRCVPLAIVNADDPICESVGRLVAAHGGAVVRFGRSARADYRVLHGDWWLDAGEVELATPGGPLTLESRLPGALNALNVAAAVAAGAALELSDGEIAATVATIAPPPGRYERVVAGQPFDVVVDMAHTPPSIGEFLATLRAVVAQRPGAALRTVLGVPGSWAMSEPRERSGRIARELSDQLIVTGSSLRGEPPLINMASILRGARRSGGGELCGVLDRREAIALALRSAKPGDIVAIAGRGPIAAMTFDRHGGGYRGSDMDIANALLSTASA
jgi:UDP-N-acetylmuramoyl-L-alanyl-D-glutamate--2,6-diaminopimelate ligase